MVKPKAVLILLISFIVYSGHLFAFQYFTYFINQNLVFNKNQEINISLNQEQSKFISPCLKFEKKSSQLPLQIISENNKSIEVIDTFWITNNCEDTLTVSNLTSATKNFFTLEDRLIPHKKTPLIFKGIIHFDNDYAFNINFFNCTINISDGGIYAVEIKVPVSYKTIKSIYGHDGSLKYVLSGKIDSRFSTILYLYPSGQLKIKGQVIDQDTNLKVGNWLYFKEGTINSSDIIYSKSISLSAKDENDKRNHNQFSVKIKENGQWKEAITDKTKNDLRLFVNPKTDSILAYSDSLNFGLKINYNKLRKYENIEFYLLKNGERTLKIKNIETPFEIKKDQYIIKLNLNYIDTPGRNLKNILDSFIIDIQNQYPEVLKISINNNEKGIDLSRLNDLEKNKLIKRLKSDTKVLFVCQIFYLNRNLKLAMYCEPIIKVSIDDRNEIKLKLLARKYGFKKTEIDSGNNFYLLTYKTKFLDEEFFSNYKSLSHKGFIFEIRFK